MAKFYVVDGISYPAAETACGVFNNLGWVSMKACRDFGFTSSKTKGALSLDAFVQKVFAYREPEANKATTHIDISPTDHYLKNSGFRVVMSNVEIELSRLYLVDGVAYERAEKRLGIKDGKGFQTMYAVCKAGAFRGKIDRKSMSLEMFRSRLAKLGVNME